MSEYNELAPDPCRAKDTSSAPRALAFVLLFVVMFGCGAVAFISDSFYGTQISSIAAYTAAVMIYGFARNRGANPPYLFTCPTVVGQYPTLIKRHAVFVTGLFLMQAIALKIKPNLPDWWTTSNGKNPPPFAIPVALLWGFLALTEIMTNRGVLERAHRNRFGDPPTEGKREENERLSLISRD